MSEYQDGWGYLTDSWSSRGTTNDGSQLCSRKPIPSPGGEPIRILVYRAPPYSPRRGLLRPPLWTEEFRPLRAQTPDKALYCLFLWLIGFYSWRSLRKPFKIHPTEVALRRHCNTVDVRFTPHSNFYWLISQESRLLMCMPWEWVVAAESPAFFIIGNNEGGPGQWAQLVRASPSYAEVVGLLPVQGMYRRRPMSA